MFNIGPMEMLVLGIVAMLVIGPEKLPGFIRDATRMLRTLREMATGARQQLRDELGPEFADVDLRSLNPRTAITRAVFGDEPPDLRGLDPRAAVSQAVFGDEKPDLTKYNPRTFDLRKASRDFVLGPESTGAEAGPSAAAAPSANPGNPAATGARPRPRPRPAAAPTPPAGYGEDIT